MTVTPAAKKVSDLNGSSVGVGFDVPAGGGSVQLSQINNKPATSVTLSIGPGLIGDVYGAATYTRVGAPIIFGGSCSVH